MYKMERSNCRFNDLIERFIENHHGTSIGSDIRNMYENGSNYESICDRMGIDYDDYKEE